MSDRRTKPQKKSGVDGAVSEVIGTNLDGKEEEIYQTMSVIEKFLEKLRAFFELLAGVADQLSEPIKNLFGSRA